MTLSQSLLASLPEILERIRNTDRILLALDFDGTLAAIADRPEHAAMPEETAAILRELSDSERLSLVILSGRSIADLKAKVDLDCIRVGNHGLEIEGAGISFVHEGARALLPAVDFACWDLEAAMEGVRGVFVERKGLTATVHYRQAPADLGMWIETTVRLTMHPYDSLLGLKPARKAWEIRPRVDWDKGSALKYVLNRIGATHPLLICAGDDTTDEDVFAAFEDAISIQVGGQSRTAARFRVNGPAQLAAFLRELRPAIGRQTAPSPPSGVASDGAPILKR